MVTSTLDNNPLDPTTIQRNSLDNSNPKSIQTHKLSELQMIVDRNVAPSPKAMCAELAHEHALEDLHKFTDHTSEQNPVRGPIYSENYFDQNALNEPRKPEE